MNKWDEFLRVNMCIYCSIFVIHDTMKPNISTDMNPWFNILYFAIFIWHTIEILIRTETDQDKPKSYINKRILRYSVLYSLSQFFAKVAMVKQPVQVCENLLLHFQIFCIIESNIYRWRQFCIICNKPVFQPISLHRLWCISVL